MASITNARCTTPQSHVKCDSSTVSETVMEGKLLKLGARGRKHWNERYFLLSGNTLSYKYHKGDVKARVCYSITSGRCSIGSLYMDQRHKGTSKELLYCFRISFEHEHSEAADDASTFNNDPPLSPGSLLIENTSPSPYAQAPDGNEEEEEEGSEQRRSHFRRSSRSRKKPPMIPDFDDSDGSPRIKPKRRPRLLLSSVIAEEGQPFLPNLDDSATDLNSTTLSYYQEQQLQEQQLMRTHYREALKEQKKKTRQTIIDGGKLALAAGGAVAIGVLTAGVGLVAGLVFIGAGAAAGGTGVVGGAAYQKMKKKSELVLASSSLEETQRWKSAFDACLVSELIRDSTWGQLFVMDGRSAKTALLPTEIITHRSADQSVGELLPRGVSYQFDDGKAVVDAGARWEPMEEGYYTLIGSNGLRIFREERYHPSHQSRLSVKESACSPLKAQSVLNASALQAFFCFMSLARVPSDGTVQPTSGQMASFRVIERMDDHSDVIHVFFRQLYLFPSWTSPRDFCLFRYWRYDPDGSYVICVDSIKHKDCPPNDNYTRGDMHGVYTIAPKKKPRQGGGDICDECLLTCVVQVDPRGWIPRGFLSTYSEAFGVSVLLQILDVKDALDHERFIPVSFDTTTPASALRHHSLESSTTADEDPVNYDFNFSRQEQHNTAGKLLWIGCHPPPLPRHKWSEPDSNSFRVRGKYYKKDKIKINAGPSIGRLIAVDVLRVDEPINSGLSVLPTERIQIALEREKRLLAKGLPSDVPPFIFLVNFVLPGPPFYHGAYYFAIDDMSSIDGTDGSPSSKLCQKFFFGDDDNFRDDTFKLIPTIVDGNFVAKKAVGSRPVLMGHYLGQRYVKNARFFEIIHDCDSGSIVRGVTRLTLGYSKTLVVDTGFVLEGNSEEYLPERILGCARTRHPEFGTNLRKVVVPVAKKEEEEQKESSVRV